MPRERLFPQPPSIGQLPLFDRTAAVANRRAGWHPALHDAGKTGENLPIELGMRLPGLSRHHASIAHGLLAHEGGAVLFRFQSHMFVTSDPFARSQACRGQNLDSVANGEDPLPGVVERADYVEELLIVSQILRRASTKNKDGVVILDPHLVECDVRFETVSGTLDISDPTSPQV